MLSAEEVLERGLDRYVDMEHYRSQTPRLLSETEILTPTRISDFSTTGAQAASCWDYSFWYGDTDPDLYGQTDVTWCGDGDWVTYDSSNCWGTDGGYPTYEFLGCDNSTNFGDGWNVYEVKTSYHLCPAWNPIWGSCVSDHTGWLEYQFQGDGGVTKLGGS
ncbi:hypothetical protein [Glycomyces xiaoerkulensis]|uniref:hypothetical protein n=1 Tax=Glycomyces xiaoerkulensis TaxID=2038139 RepID=UPI0013000872|nr:hypothetical protein [Glycomyces xiaoerkulensis]